MSLPVDLVLASASPRRCELLKQIGVRFDVQPVDIDESRQQNESAQDFVQRLAWQKAEAGWRQSPDGLPVLGADTIVVLAEDAARDEIIGDKIMGKPANQDEAIAMLSQLSGRVHHVLTGVTIVHGDHHASILSDSRVTFRDLSQAELRAYCAGGEPFGKAGAYAIQGLAAVFVKHLQGSYSGVMGLPLFETADLLTQFGINVLHNHNEEP